MEKELVAGIERLVTTLGFPILTSCWFMFRMEKKLDKQTAVMETIARSMQELVATHRGD